MAFPPSPSAFYIGDDHDDDHVQYFNGPRAFHHPASTSYEMLHRAEKKRKLTNHHHLSSAMPIVHGNGPKRPRNQLFDQGRIDGPRGTQSGTEFEPILLDPEDYVIEEPETHSFHAFDWTLDQRRVAATNHSVTVRKPPHLPLLVPPPPPPPVIPTISMVDTPTNVNLRQNSIDRSEIRRRSSPMEPPLPQQQRKILPIPASMSSTGPLPLPLPKPTAALPRTPAKRGRPAKAVHSRRPLEPSPPAPPVRSTLETPIVPTSPVRPVATMPPIHQSHSEIRRQTLNGTGIFSAFHDTKYYRCNICKFKSVTSSTLLQHLFTHLFFCQQCSYYTFSNYQLAQHLFDKHQLNIFDDNSQPSNPSSFDLLYLTRCADGTFALCMDALASSPTPSAGPTQEPSQPSSSTFNQVKTVPTKKRKVPRPEEPTLTIAVESQLSSTEPAASRNVEPAAAVAEKPPIKFILMKNRSFYSLRKPTCLHALTLEYEICRRETLTKKLHCSPAEQRELTRRSDQPRRLIDEIAHCLRTVVNQVVQDEENGANSSVSFTLPEQVLCSIFPTDDLQQLTNALKLTPKSNNVDESRDIPPINAFENHIFVLGIPQTVHDEEMIRSTLHSNTTNGELAYTHTKLPRLPLTCDNTFRFFRSSTNNRWRGNTKKVLPKAKAPSPSGVPPATTVMSNSTPNHSSASHRVDRNNNSITSSQSKGSSNTPPTDSPLIIVLD